MFNFLKGKRKEVSFKAPVAGKVVNIETVPDEVFSQKMVGDGVAIEPTDGLVVSPVKGKLVQIFPTNHAIAILTEEGLEVLIHLGIDTVELKGEGFERIAAPGQDVEPGTPLVKMDLEFIKSKGKPVITPVVITNFDVVETIEKALEKNVALNAEIFKVTLK